MTEKKINELSQSEVVRHHIEEIYNMRDEINWRVKLAYTGSVIFMSAITFACSTLFEKDSALLKELKSDPSSLTVAGLVALLAVSAYSGVQTANHLVEKRIEMYSLELMKIIYKQSGRHAYASWLGFLYGNEFFKGPLPNWFSRTLNAAIGFFMYFLPNLISIFLWIYLVKYGMLQAYFIWFVIISFFALVSVLTTLMFFIYMHKVSGDFRRFYDEAMHPYFCQYGLTVSYQKKRQKKR